MLIEKSKEEMLQELNEFVRKEVFPIQNYVNRDRKFCSLAYVAAISFLIGIILLIFVQNKISFSFILIAIIIMLVLGVSSKKDYNYNEYGSDTSLKRKLMPNFLKIFGENIKLGNVSSKFFAKTLSDNLKRYKQLSIMNPCLFSSLNDIIYGDYKNVEFFITEVSTSFFSSLNALIILFAAVFFVPFIITAFVVCIIITAMMFNISVILGNACLLLFLVLLVFLFQKIVGWVPFKGIIVDFDMNKRFVGQTIILERGKTTKGIKIDKRKFQEVILEDSSFMNKYVVYSDDQVEARYLLTPSFIERFNNIQMAFKAKFIRACFKEKKVTLSINSGKDLFSMVDFWKDTNKSLFVILFEELYSVLSLIDSFKLNQKIGL